MSKWTPSQDKRLGVLWDEGLSASQISRAFNGMFSRSAVISRKNRLGLAPRATTANRHLSGWISGTKPAPKKKLFVPKAVVEEPPSVGAFGDTGCKWPVGEPSELLSCGQKRHERYPYCEDHCSRAFAPARQKEMQDV